MNLCYLHSQNCEVLGANPIDLSLNFRKFAAVLGLFACLYQCRHCCKLESGVHLNRSCVELTDMLNAKSVFISPVQSLHSYGFVDISLRIPIFSLTSPLFGFIRVS